MSECVCVREALLERESDHEGSLVGQLAERERRADVVRGRLLEPSRPRLVPARPKVCTSHVREPLHFLTRADVVRGRLLSRCVSRLCYLFHSNFIVIS